ncbi:hypothetical protein ACOMHN_049443 [Nucella lapillus]
MCQCSLVQTDNVSGSVYMWILVTVPSFCSHARANPLVFDRTAAARYSCRPWVTRHFGPAQGNKTSITFFTVYRAIQWFSGDEYFTRDNNDIRQFCSFGKTSPTITVCCAIQQFFGDEYFTRDNNDIRQFCSFGKTSDLTFTVCSSIQQFSGDEYLRRNNIDRQFCGTVSGDRGGGDRGHIGWTWPLHWTEDSFGCLLDPRVRGSSLCRYRYLQKCM